MAAEWRISSLLKAVIHLAIGARMTWPLHLALSTTAPDNSMTNCLNWGPVAPQISTAAVQQLKPCKLGYLEAFSC